jgi:hypothetical protein
MAGLRAFSTMGNQQVCDAVKNGKTTEREQQRPDTDATK